MEYILNALNHLFRNLFGIWNTATFAGLLIFCGAYLIVKMIKGMLRH